MKTLKARGNDIPANVHGDTKLLFQVTDIRMCRYFVLSDLTQLKETPTVPPTSRSCLQPQS